MPYCFVQSGVILSILLIFISGLLTRLSCYFLLKSSFISRRRSFELIVQDVLGSSGRLMVELGLIGFLMGTCVAYFIMIGDLAPKIISELVDINYSRNLRMATVVILSIFVALPLSLLRRVDSLTSFSLLSMILYSCLIVKLMFETNDMLVRESTTLPGDGSNKTITESKIVYWNTAGLLTTFPIFSMAMSCQTSLFEIFDSSVIHSDTESIKRDNSIIEKAIYLCSFVYLTVGLLGYMAFHEQTLYGNLLLAFQPSLTTTLTKIGFIITLLMSFPLCVFPCRTSVYSLTIGKLKKSGNFQQLPMSTLTQTSSNTTIGIVNDFETKNSHISDQIMDKKNNCDNSFMANNNNTITTNHLNDDYIHMNTLARVDQANGGGGNIQSSNYLKPTNRMLSLNYIQKQQQSIPYKSLLEDDEDDCTENCDTSLEQMQHQAANNHHPNGFNTHQNHQASQMTASKLYISDFHFRLLTVILIAVTVVLSLMIPNIEFILGIIGSTAGTTVCFILPAYTFISIGQHSKTELLLARLLLLIGLNMLIFCTYSTILSVIDVPTK